MSRIVITTTTFGKDDKTPLNILKQAGFEIGMNPYGRSLKKDEIVEICKDAAGIVAGTEQLDGDTMKNLRNLKVISRCGSGMDNVDLDAAKRLGIKIFNTPDAPVEAVAELTICLILSLFRKVIQMHISIKNSGWQKETGSLLSGKKIGIIGFGKIGTKVAELLKAFNCEIAYADPYVEDGLMGLRRLPISELLAWADLITIHASKQDRIIGREQLQIIKKGSWLINTSRGGVIDEDALYKALKQGYLSGAAIDVFQQEPYAGPLKELDNVILTPHIGSYAKEARIKMELEAAQNLLIGLQER